MQNALKVEIETEGDIRRRVARSREEVSDPVEAKIIHTLTIYPKLSPSMLQAGIGPGIAPRVWRPALERLVKAGIVRKQEAAMEVPYSGRYQTYRILSLA
jgi:DNA-binding HxlR family transcriptional regulator